jgi:NitT/TauT family transport system substrate-binding protein
MRRVETFQLRVGYLPVATSTPYWVGVEEGFFNDEGLNITLIEFRSGPKALEAVIAGSLDVCSIAIFTTAMAYEAGIDLRIATDMGHLDQNHTGSFIVVSANSSIETVADLKGKNVAIHGWGTIQEMVLIMLLNEYNLTITDVNIVTLKFSKQYEALLSGAIDAALLVEPYLTYAVDTGNFRKLHSTMSWIFEDRRFQIGATVFLNSLLDEHKDTVDAFIRVQKRAVEWMNNHQNETRGIISKYTGLDVELVQRIQTYTHSTQLDPELVSRCLDLMLQQGFLEQQINVEDLIYVP